METALLHISAVFFILLLYIASVAMAVWATAKARALIMLVWYGILVLDFIEKQQERWVPFSDIYSKVSVPNLEEIIELLAVQNHIRVRLPYSKCARKMVAPREFTPDMVRQYEYRHCRNQPESGSE